MDMFVFPLKSVNSTVASNPKEIGKIMSHMEQRRSDALSSNADKRKVNEELREISRTSTEGSFSVAQRKRVLDIYHANLIVTSADYYYAATALQYGKEKDDILLSHELAVVAAIRGFPSASKLVAETWDRFLLSMGLPQRYGTYFLYVSDDKGGHFTLPEPSPSVSDSIRSQFHVRPLAETRALVEHLNRALHTR